MSEAIDLSELRDEPYYLALADEIELFEAAYRARLPILLKGPTGCGKTRFVEYMAWRLKLPSILLLLFSGVIVGPVTGVLEPDRLFGELLFPGVSLAVGLILFEGGLSLEWSELKGIRGTVNSLILIGSTVTLIVSATAAHSTPAALLAALLSRSFRSCAASGHLLLLISREICSLPAK